LSAHGESITAAQRFIAAGVMVIDLSADFRLKDPAAYRRWYGKEHSAPALLDDFVYGLCEVNRAQLRGARRIANPGCYPTGVNLGLYPLAKAGWLGDRVIVDSKSSVSGAGRTAKLPYLFVEVNENMSPYSIGYRHRHIAEMELVLHAAAGSPVRFTFSPHLLPLNRGILSTMYVTVPAGVERATDALPLRRDLRGRAVHPSAARGPAGHAAPCDPQQPLRDQHHAGRSRTNRMAATTSSSPRWTTWSRAPAARPFNVSISQWVCQRPKDCCKHDQ
jgi:hypothetical protein